MPAAVVTTRLIHGDCCLRILTPVVPGEIRLSWFQKKKVKGKKKPVVKRTYLDVETDATISYKHKLNGMNDLKDNLVEHKSQGFAERFTEKLLSYALSRDVDFYDDEMVQNLNSKFMAANFSAKTLIKDIMTSKEFVEGEIK